ncbi:glycosyltransferase [Paenibacillus lautus]|uniref:Glycosyltransferase n=1 Tax=Paenibacillus lautus TaxID=1401 RepID=A0A385TH75_PAELA|nr:glycosyltransferase [Paenibacillus lautus]AYB41922.1 glycosyltransferase [Paenibacillus lautus]
MRKIKILGVYKWATMGGVERVLLNRAHAIQENNLNIQYDIYYFFDSGGREEFDNYLIRNNLSDIMKTVDQIDSYKYDFVLSIDTPEILDFVEPEKLYMECHTSYKKNRSYLKSLPASIKGIVVPSEQFKEELQGELSTENKNKLVVVSNSVFIKKSNQISDAIIYSKTPILYVGRLDILKNIEELVEVVSLYNTNIEDDLFLILAGPIIEHEINLKEILTKHRLLHRTIYLPPVSFDKVWDLLRIVKDHRGIFMSASKKESFGLAVAEAMKMGLPVLAFDNVAHRHLLKDNDNYLFDAKQGSVTIEKMGNILKHYEDSAEEVERYSLSLEKEFIEQWMALFN